MCKCMLSPDRSRCRETVKRLTRSAASLLTDLLAAILQLGALLLALLDIVQDFVKLALRDLRTLLGLLIKGVSHLLVLCPGRSLPRPQKASQIE